MLALVVDACVRGCACCVLFLRCPSFVLVPPVDRAIAGWQLNCSTCTPAHTGRIPPPRPAPRRCWLAPGLEQGREQQQQGTQGDAACVSVIVIDACFCPLSLVPCALLFGLRKKTLRTRAGAPTFQQPTEILRQGEYAVRGTPPPPPRGWKKVNLSSDGDGEGLRSCVRVRARPYRTTTSAKPSSPPSSISTTSACSWAACSLQL